MFLLGRRVAVPGPAAIAGVAALLVSIVAVPVWACGAWSPLTITGPDGPVPQNAAGFPVTDWSSAEPSLVFRRRSGETLAAELRRWPPGAFGSFLLVPQTPPEPGQYEIVRTFPGDDREHINQFEITASVPHPAAAGSVQVVRDTRARLWVWDNAGGCGGHAPAVRTLIYFAPSAELRPFLSIARVSVYVDGVPWAETAQDGRWTTNQDYPGPALREPFAVFTVCGPARDLDRFPTDRGVGEGVHEGELIVTVAGMAPLPAVPFAFEMECPETFDDDVSPDAGAGGIGTPPDGGASLPQGPDAPPMIGGTGCTLAAQLPRDQRHPWGVGLAWLLVAIVLRHRRRPSARCSGQVSSTFPSIWNPEHRGPG